jgi:hypothetical protein
VDIAALNLILKADFDILTPPPLASFARVVRIYDRKARTWSSLVSPATEPSKQDRKVEASVCGVLRAWISR